MSLITELKRRNVFRVGVAYGIVAWLLIEVASVILPTFKTPEWVMQAFTTLVILGFPLALIVAWAFELTPEGIKRETAVDPDESITHLTGRKLDFAIIGLLVVAVVYFAVDKFVLEQAEVTAELIPVAESVAREKSIRSLAVLPLENLSGDPEQEYFADAMTDMLIGELAKIGSLGVISRTSIMQYKGTRKTAREIANELGVDGLIEGAVFRQGNRVRITVQLVGRNDRHVWADHFEGEFDKLFSMQMKVARSVAEGIQLQLTPQEETLLTEKRSVDSAALDAYLRGGYHIGLLTPSDTTKAIAYFEDAVQKDPSFARAYAELSRAYRYAVSLGEATMSREQALPRMRESALKALALDDTLAAAHTAWGLSLLFGWEWEQAGKELLRGAELAPNSPFSLTGRSYYLSLTGRHEEALALQARAVELAPKELNWRNAYARRLYYARDYERALEEVDKILRMDPGFEVARFWQWLANLKLGNREEAGRALVEFMKAVEDAWLVEAVERGYQAAGGEGALKAWLEVPAERVRAGLGFGAPYFVANHYAETGAVEPAFDWLERAYRDHDTDLVYLGIDPLLDPLRSDPRFADLLQRINYPGS